MLSCLAGRGLVSRRAEADTLSTPQPFTAAIIPQNAEKRNRSGAGGRGCWILSVVRRGGFHIRPGAFAAARGLRDDASIVPYRGRGWPRGLRQFCLPCQREVARPKAVTEGLPYGGLTFERSGTPEWSPGRTMCAPTGGWRLAAGFVFSRRAAMFPAEHCGGAGCGGMRASRPTVARVVAVVPVGPKRKIYS